MAFLPRSRRAVLSIAALATVLAPATVASAGESQPSVVSERSVDTTPRLVTSSAVAQPHVDALAGTESTMFAGGLFETVSQDGVLFPRQNLLAMERSTGRLSATFTSSVAGQVWALATDPATDSLYVGGKFTTVNGTKRPALAKLDATTGLLDPTFKPPFGGGQINDLKLIEVDGVKHLVIAGSSAGKVMSLNPATGKDDGWIQLTVADQLPGSWGTVAGYQMAVDPSRTHLAVTGNFQTVNGEARTKFFMLDLAPTGGTLSPWYYPGFAKPCSSTAPRRIPSLQGVDFSPDGSAFTVTATGQVPLHKSEIWYQRLGDDNLPNTTVCDGFGRFSLDDPTKPDWINYTGGDSVWTVSDTGSAVYVAGHFKWVDNPDGRASIGTGDMTSGAPAANRPGIAAVDPATGLALSWNPRLGQTKMGGKALLADSAGLWIGNDATTFAGAPRRGLQFAPLPPAAPVPGP